MFDLNVDTIDIAGEAYDASNVFQPESSSHCHEAGPIATNIPASSNSVPSTALDQEAPSESGGVTFPTAATASAAADVEEGVEVMSTPTEPHVGLTFESVNAAKNYYNSYARYKGFATRIDTSRFTKRDNGKSKCLFVCHKAGVNKKVKCATDGPITEKKVVSQRRRDHVERTKCPARMVVRITSNGLWEVVSFVADHDHDLVAKFSLTKFLNSHREIPAEEVDFIKTLHGCCIETTRAYQIMAELYGGVENVPYTKTDCKNLRRTYGAENEGHDMKATFEFFDELKKEDPDFFYDFTLDDEGRVEHVFWVDGEARRMFGLYGDCVSFDTT